jgi:hypothetical protein
MYGQGAIVGIYGESESGYGVVGTSDTGAGVSGYSTASYGVMGIADTAAGVWGQSVGGIGVYGQSDSFVGVSGYSSSLDGVQGQTTSGHAGVSGRNLSDMGGYGVWGYAGGSGGYGIWGYASGSGGVGVYGQSDGLDGVQGVSGSPLNAGVSARNTSAASGQVPGGYAVWASSNNTGIFAHGTPAGYFEGDVLVTGDLVLVNEGGDIAEGFDVEATPLSAEPGTVLIIQENGSLRESEIPYDTRVAGVVAGAGNLKPAVILQHMPSQKDRAPIALVGKVFCKVDAAFGEIVAGDLLTTSSTPGHAMKASDKSQAFGAIVGKALAGLGTGLGLIPILVSLR